MAMLYTVATCLLSVLSPQGPGPQSQGAPAPFEMARVLPKESLMAVTINPMGRHADAIRETGLFKILERVVQQGGMGPQIQMGLAQVAMMTGLTQEQLETALSSGMGFSWSGLGPSGEVGWVAAVNLGGSADALAKTFEQLLNMAKTQGTVKGEMWGDTLVHAIRLSSGVELAAAVHGELLVLASSQGELEEALARWDGHGTPSLMEHPEFKGIVAELQGEGDPMCGFFMQPAEVANLVARNLPPETSGPVREAMRALQVHKLSALGYGAFVRDGEFHDYARLVFPEPRTGLLATLLTGSGEVEPNLFRMIPPDVSGYSLVSMSVSQILDRALAVASAVSPEAERSVGQLLVNLKNQSGVDLEEDLMSTIGEQILSMQWPGGEVFGSDMAMVVTLHDAWRFENAWEAIQRMVPAPIRVTTIDNKRIYRYANPEIPEERWPVMTVAGDYLVIASGEKTFRRVLAQMDKPEVNNPARAHLAKLPEETFMTAWVDLGESLGSQIDMLKGLAPMGQADEIFGQLQDAVRELAGVMHTTVVRDERGVVYRSRSPIGNTQGLAMVMIGASVAIPNFMSRTMSSESPVVTEVEWDYGMSGLMQVIAGAEQDFVEARASDRDENGIAEYGDLADLVEKGFLSEEDLGEDLGEGVYRRDGHMITLILPDGTDGRETHYVAVAWPDEGRTGMVYGSTQNRPAMANDIIAGVSGIQRMDLRDIFIGGSFTAGLVTGWRDIGDVSALPRRTGDNAKEDREEVRMALEAEETEDAGTLVRLLKSGNQDVAARAAYALGNLQATDAVPELCEVLTSRPELEVRLQAMDALNKLGDPRSQKASTQVLDSESVMLRALAATNLGKLRDPDSVQPLLNMLGATVADDADHRDQVQALLALHDIGEADCLLPAAAAAKTGDENVDRALAYLFQNLSRKLDPKEEASALMAVLDHDNTLLRRYAIQRLGELKDKTTVRALEGRLAVEEESLQPLIEIALGSIRGDSVADSGKLVDQAKEKATELWGTARKEWGRLTDQERMMAKAAGCVFLLLVMMLMLRRARRKHRLRGEEAAAMVAPSQEIDEVLSEDWGDEEPVAAGRHDSYR